MRPTATPSPRLLAVLLALPFAGIVLVGAIFVDAKDGAGRVPVTGGVAGGVLHPVAGSFEPDATSLDSCGEDDSPCPEQALGNLAHARGPAAALSVVDARLEVDASFAGSCHRVVHVIGSAALARERGEVTGAFARGSATCASG